MGGLINKRSNMGAVNTNKSVNDLSDDLNNSSKVKHVFKVLNNKEVSNNRSKAYEYLVY